MMWDYGWSWPGLFMMSLTSILWIAVIAFLIWAVVRWVDRKNAHISTPTPTVSAMETLRQRYARGEIDTATFTHMREQLEARAQEPYMQQSRGPISGVH
ncbi:MAG TPA: SHOCT domain-containing protein [Ktedonobacteraceae bacterium]|jgi:putative membrane protein|nr:SHOCT domain-containing protein [Ktedonobacteraceae bacterium]